jgi:hypothetical protein
MGKWGLLVNHFNKLVRALALAKNRGHALELKPSPLTYTGTVN